MRFDHFDLYMNDSDCSGRCDYCPYCIWGADVDYGYHPRACKLDNERMGDL